MRCFIFCGLDGQTWIYSPACIAYHWGRSAIANLEVLLGFYLLLFEYIQVRLWPTQTELQEIDRLYCERWNFYSVGDERLNVDMRPDKSIDAVHSLPLQWFPDGFRGVSILKDWFVGFRVLNRSYDRTPPSGVLGTRAPGIKPGWPSVFKYHCTLCCIKICTYSLSTCTFVQLAKPLVQNPNCNRGKGFLQTGTFTCFLNLGHITWSSYQKTNSFLQNNLR